jgi:hypothetical protein
VPSRRACSGTRVTAESSLHRRYAAWFAVGCMALTFACSRAERSSRRDAREAPRDVQLGRAKTAPSITSQPGPGALGAPTTSLKSALGFECREVGPEPSPLAAASAGAGPQLKSAGGAGLPDGPIAYVADEKLWVVSSDGQRRWLLGRGSHPQWHPGAASLLFVAALADSLPRLFEVALDCSAFRMLTGPLTVTQESSAGAPDLDASSYAVSPDGERVAFTRPGELQNTLYVVERATGAESKLALEVEAGGFAWFPDSRTLAFITGDALSSTIMSVELATGQTRKLVSVRRGLVAVLPDSRLLFQAAADADNTIEARQARLYQLQPQGGAAHVLKGSALGPGVYDELRTSPDGTKLAASWSLWTGNGPAALRDHGLAVFPVPPSPPPSAPPADVRAPGSPFDSTGAILFTRPKAPNASQSVSGERYAARAPSWASNSRHVVFELASCDELSDCRSQIVAVDTSLPQAPLVFLANGSVPVWARR